MTINCYEPFVHADIIVENNNIYYMPCNVYKKKFSNLDFTEVQNQFKANNWAEGCGYCKKTEEAGLISRRIGVNRKYDDLGILPNKGIQSLSLRYGTLCNSTCLICDESRSSAWASKKLNQGQSVDPKFVYKKSLMPNIKTLLSQIDLSLIKDVEFHGGEPLLASYPWEVLDLISNYDLSIKFNTNGTVWPKQMEELKKYKSVELIFSIDDIDSRFEFLRPPAKFSTVIENVDKSKNYKFKTGCCYVVSNLNVYYLPEFFLWALKKFGLTLFGQFIIDDGENAVYNIPDNAKKRVIEKFNLYPRLNKLLDPVVSEMNRSTTTVSDKFLNLTNTQEYKDVFTEWAEIINEKDTLYRQS